MATSENSPSTGSDGLGAAVVEAANIDRERTALDPFVDALRTFAIVATAVVLLSSAASGVALVVAKRRRSSPSDARPRRSTAPASLR